MEPVSSEVLRHEDDPDTVLFKDNNIKVGLICGNPKTKRKTGKQPRIDICAGITTDNNIPNIYLGITLIQFGTQHKILTDTKLLKIVYQFPVPH